MFNTKEQFEECIEYITRKSCACGIYLILSTQRVYEGTITNKIKSCFRNIIAFNLSSVEDSKLLIDCDDAKYLVGNGDFLYKDSQDNLQRLTAYYISNDNIKNLLQGLYNE